MSTVACRVSTLVPAIPALPVSLPLHRSAWLRIGLSIVEAWAAGRARARHRAQLRALAALDARLLRDVGLSELGAQAYGPSWLDIERARW